MLRKSKKAAGKGPDLHHVGAWLLRPSKLLEIFTNYQSRASDEFDQFRASTLSL